jgi:hypothetical protein
MAWSASYPQEKKRAIWRAANLRYRQRHPDRQKRSVQKYLRNHPAKRRATLRNWRARSIGWDQIQVRHEMAQRLKISPLEIPLSLIKRRAILRRIRRTIREFGKLK